MNINPLTSIQREHVIGLLAEGLGPRAANTMRDTLSDGWLRSAYEQTYHQAVPADAAIISSVPIQPVGQGRSGCENEALPPTNQSQEVAA